MTDLVRHLHLTRFKAWSDCQWVGNREDEEVNNRCRCESELTSKREGKTQLFDV